MGYRWKEQEMKTSVMIIDGYTAIREMLSMVLAQEGSYEVVAEASSGPQAMQLLAKKKPKIVILDLVLPELSGLEVLRHIRAEHKARVFVFTATSNHELIFEAMSEHPHGYVNKWDSLAVFREALRAVAKGARYFSPSTSEIQDRLRRSAPPAWSALTMRERTVVQMVAEGKSSKEVAASLSISSRTVDDYRSQVMKKLGLHDLTALTRYAVQRGVVPLG